MDQEAQARVQIENDCDAETNGPSTSAGARYPRPRSRQAQRGTLNPSSKIPVSTRRRPLRTTEDDARTKRSLATWSATCHVCIDYWPAEASRLDMRISIERMGTLKPQQQRSWYLTELALGQIERLKRSESSVAQRNALARWRNVRGPGHDVLAFLRAGLEVFNHLFFMGHLSNVCLVLSDTGPVSADHYKHGHTEEDPKTGALRIFVDVDQGGLPNKHGEGSLSTLLHEVPHAYFMRYESGAESETDSLMMRGVGGHGLAWQYLAKALEHACHLYLDFNADLGIAHAVRVEVGETSDAHSVNIEPCECDLERIYNGRCYAEEAESPKLLSRDERFSSLANMLNHFYGKQEHPSSEGPAAIGRKSGVSLPAPASVNRNVRRSQRKQPSTNVVPSMFDTN